MRTEKEIFKDFEKLGWTVNKMYTTEQSFLKQKFGKSGVICKYEIFINIDNKLFGTVFRKIDYTITKYYCKDQITKRYIRDKFLTRKEQKLLIELYKCWGWL